MALLGFRGVLPAAAQKTDTLHLRNGDRVVGEVKSLSRALLSYSTDNMQTVAVEWDAVAALVSRSRFEVQLQSGTKYYGRLTTAPAGYLVVSSAGTASTDTLPLGLVVHIVPMDRDFWSRLDGYVDLGFTYQRANHSVQLTFGSEVVYRGPRAGVTINGAYFLQDQDSVTPTSRSSLSLVEQLFLPRRWAMGTSQSFERNEELQLESRIKLGVGAGRFMAQNDAVEFSLGAGAVLLREQYTGEADAPVTVEGQLIAEFDAFKYNHPKLDLATNLTVYPGISEWGRVRVDFDGRVSYEVIKDFYLTLSVFERYDSRPPSETAAKSDFGTTLSVSWSF